MKNQEHIHRKDDLCYSFYELHRGDFLYTLRVQRDFVEQTLRSGANVWGVLLFCKHKHRNDDEEQCVAEYNHYIDIDGITNCSAIYPVFTDEKGNDFVSEYHPNHYEIDFSESDWLIKLFKAMIKVHQKFAVITA